MKYLATFLLSLCFVSLTKGQEKDSFDQEFYLIEPFPLAELFPEDRKMLDSCLKVYHTETEDSIRLNGLLYIAENLYDDHWFDYNIFLGEKIEERLEGLESGSYWEYYKNVLAGVHNNYGYYYRNSGKPQKALEYFRRGLKGYQDTDNPVGECELLNKIGEVYGDMDISDSSKVYFERGISISEANNDPVGKVMSYNNLAGYYLNAFDLARSMEYYLVARQYAEEISYLDGQYAIANNISTIYTELGQHRISLKYVMESLELCKKIGDVDNQALIMNNAGVAYQQIGKYDSALILYREAYVLGQKINRPFQVAISQKNIGELYYRIDLLDSARFYLENCLPYFERTNDIDQSSYIHTSLGTIFFKQGKIGVADYHAKKGLSLAEQIHDIRAVLQASNILYKIREAQGNYPEALKFHKLSKKLNDSTQNQEQANEAIYRELTYNFDKEQAIKEAESKHELSLAAEREKRQTYVSYGIAGILFIVSFLSYFIYDRLKLTQTQKRIIEDQKHLVEEARDDLQRKNKQIVDSIHYAKRIQQALLKSEELSKLNLPEHFILFKPKDIVSGDFYWLMEKSPYLYVAVADCTGHGVPGAFLTMLGTSYLNEINRGDSSKMPSEILNSLRDRIIKELSQSGDADATKDGMDISLIRLNTDTFEMNWTGAHNPLYIVSNGEIEVIKADKQPIGYYEKMVPFSNNNHSLKKGDLIYLFTDGYADQFGGPKGKKFLYKQFKEMILANSSLPLEKQKGLFEKEFEDWKGNQQQLDDVCMIGLKV